MRYLIIDMDKIADIIGYETLSLKNHKGEEMILTKEESLAKFKEIWEHGWDTHYYEDRSLNPQKWEDLEKTL